MSKIYPNINNSWLRMRGAHHVKNWWEKPFFCEGCQKNHGGKIMRTEVDGKLYCERTYYKLLDARAVSENELVLINPSPKRFVFHRTSQSEFDFPESAEYPKKRIRPDNRPKIEFEQD